MQFNPKKWWSLIGDARQRDKDEQEQREADARVQVGMYYMSRSMSVMSNNTMHDIINKNKSK